MMEADPTLSSAFVFSELEIAGKPGFQIISALESVIPSTVRINDVLPNEYLGRKLTEDLGL
ncbi:hypothetical protein AO735_08715 [Pseudomonas sp. TTU2014-096BSC]|nr:hypothetical protein AO735_08715 [Pseudomonas sp. TTU2014-096BSC]